MTDSQPEKYSAEEWEHLRSRFSDSILNDTEIAVLGQNASISWPFKGSDETPAKYIEYDFEELQSVPGLIGKKRRVRTLMDILRETLAFDDPFADMVGAAETKSLEDDTFERILDKLAIPPDFPADLVRFSAETRRLIEAEGLSTLIEIIHFGQQLTPDSVVGVDIKNFLNGLAHDDEAGIAQHVPYRRRERGLHLAEGIGLIAADLRPTTQLELLYQSGLPLTEEETAERAEAEATDTEAELNAALERVAANCRWFTAEADELKQVLGGEGSPERYFIHINDSRRERVAVILARAHFGLGTTEKRGFLGKISGLFGR